MKSLPHIRLGMALMACLSAPLALAQSQGVSKTEINLGSIQDLSGPLAGFGKQVRLGMLLAVDELNEQGGINGRKLTIKIEDSGYDPKKAFLAAQKLVNQDKIFAMVGHIGTAQNLAAMPVQFEKNVVNFFPVTAAREMFEPFHRLKYSFAATYYDQVRVSTAMLAKEKGVKRAMLLPVSAPFHCALMAPAADAMAEALAKAAPATTASRPCWMSWHSSALPATTATAASSTGAAEGWKHPWQKTLRQVISSSNLKASACLQRSWTPVKPCSGPSTP